MRGTIVKPGHRRKPYGGLTNPAELCADAVFPGAHGGAAFRRSRLGRRPVVGLVEWWNFHDGFPELGCLDVGGARGVDGADGLLVRFR